MSDGSDESLSGMILSVRETACAWLRSASQISVERLLDPGSDSSGLDREHLQRYARAVEHSLLEALLSSGIDPTPSCETSCTKSQPDVGFQLHDVTRSAMQAFCDAAGSWQKVAAPWRRLYFMACSLKAAQPLAHVRTDWNLYVGKSTVDAPALGRCSQLNEKEKEASISSVEELCEQCEASLRLVDMALIASPSEDLGAMQREPLHAFATALHVLLVNLPAGGEARASAQAVAQEDGKRRRKRSFLELDARPDKKAKRSEATTQHISPTVLSGTVLFAGEGEPLARIDALDVEGFQQSFLGRSPALVQGVARHWPALRLWRIGVGRAGSTEEEDGDAAYEYLARVAGKRTVPVEIGRSYTDQGSHSRLVALESLLDRLRLESDADEQEGEERRSQQRGREGEGEVGTDPGGMEGGGWYLAQHALLDQIPALARDVDEPLVCRCPCGAMHDGGARSTQQEGRGVKGGGREGEGGRGLQTRGGGGRVRKVNVWVGPGGTVSPLHQDPLDNVLCQVAGAKYVRIYSTAHTASMRPGVANLSNTSTCTLECGQQVGEEEGGQTVPGALTVPTVPTVPRTVPFWEVRGCLDTGAAAPLH
jgi:hypothetical protein